MPGIRWDLQLEVWMRAPELGGGGGQGIDKLHVLPVVGW